MNIFFIHSVVISTTILDKCSLFKKWENKRIRSQPVLLVQLFKKYFTITGKIKIMRMTLFRTDDNTRYLSSGKADAADRSLWVLISE